MPCMNSSGDLFYFVHFFCGYGYIFNNSFNTRYILLLKPLVGNRLLEVRHNKGTRRINCLFTAIFRKLQQQSSLHCSLLERSRQEIPSLLKGGLCHWGQVSSTQGGTESSLRLDIGFTGCFYLLEVCLSSWLEYISCLSDLTYY